MGMSDRENGLGRVNPTAVVDEDTNTAYISLTRWPTAYSVEINENLILDLDSTGRVSGIELLNADGLLLPTSDLQNTQKLTAPGVLPIGPDTLIGNQRVYSEKQIQKDRTLIPTFPRNK